MPTKNITTTRHRRVAYSGECLSRQRQENRNAGCNGQSRCPDDDAAEFLSQFAYPLSVLLRSLLNRHDRASGRSEKNPSLGLSMLCSRYVAPHTAPPSPNCQCWSATSVIVFGGPSEN